MRKLKTVLAISAFAGMVSANNLQVSNVSLEQKNEDTAEITFDIAWENSWRDTENHDAAWVFFKARTNGTQSTHARLYSATAGDVLNPSDWSRGTGTAVDLIAPADRVGLFVRRAAEGSGTLTTTKVKVLWDCRGSGFQGVPSVGIAAEALEMVYVPQGEYDFGRVEGDTTGDDDSIKPLPLVHITTGDADMANGHPAAYTPDSASWPNGYNAFYCMKHELSSGLWCDFYNSLARAQRDRQLVATNLSSGSKITYISSDPFTGNWASSIPWRPMGATLIRHAAGFFDWSGLRFLTEMEVVKASRGPVAAISGEYPWGTASLTKASSWIDWNSVSERPGSGICVNGGPIGRCGAFATATSSREQAGATYWGIMEMGGNMFERIINLSTAEGRAYTGLHGDGLIATNGYADVSHWPCSVADGGTGKNVKGAGMWGGSNSSPSNKRIQITNRYLIETTDPNTNTEYGFRGVRTAPACAATGAGAAADKSARYHGGSGCGAVTAEGDFIGAVYGGGAGGGYDLERSTSFEPFVTPAGMIVLFR